VKEKDQSGGKWRKPFAAAAETNTNIKQGDHSVWCRKIEQIKVNSKIFSGS
jgi:hypothetical protein